MTRRSFSTTSFPGNHVCPNVTWEAEGGRFVTVVEEWHHVGGELGSAQPDFDVGNLAIVCSFGLLVPLAFGKKCPFAGFEVSLPSFERPLLALGLDHSQAFGIESSVGEGS